jgi:TonB-linked SusC/RagA family outer membrane protein
MNKTKPIQDGFLLLMKFSLIQAFILTISASFGMALNLNGQILEKKVVLHLNDRELSGVLKEISRQTSARFTYQPDVIEASKKITLHADNLTLEEVLQNLLGADVAYYAVGREIILKVRRPESDVAKDSLVNIGGNKNYRARVAGTVVDEAGSGLPGVNVVIKGTTFGTNTDADGHYALDVENDTDVLVFSFIGFKTQEQAVGGRTVINITLEPDVQSLQEVVVVGYGTQREEAVTGAVSSVSARQLQQSPVANLSNALAGRLPGLITVQRGGEPGNDAAQIWIRGFGTYNGNQAPLVMVDGVERSFDNIDPSEVETIAILKDASATAVYGVRGANGVVLVTTKRGSERKPEINVTIQNGVQTPTRLPEYLDSYDALKLYREGLVNDGLNASQYTDEYIAKFRDRSNPTYEYLYPNVNWQEEMLKKQSQLFRANINVSGGTAAARYFVSTSYTRQDGLYNFEDRVQDYDIQAILNRYNFRANTDITLARNLNMELNIGGVIRDRNYPNVNADYFWTRIKMTPPWWYPMTNPNGSIAGSPSLEFNPYGMLTAQGYRRNFETTLQSTTGFTLKMPWVTEGLSVRARLSFDAVNWRDVTRGKSFYSYRFTIPEEATDLTQGTYSKTTDGTNILSYDVGANGRRRTLVELFMNYDRVFGRHDFKGLLLYTQQSTFEAVGSGNGVEGLPYKYQGVIGRIAYAYAYRYFVEFNFGYNGSENFPRGKRMGLFPAMSVGWMLSEEPFIKNNIPALSLLKLRGSMGEVGNDKTGNARFLYQGRWSLSGPGYTFGENYNGRGYGGAEESAAGNPDVTWERARKYNVGIDVGLWNNAIKLEANVFHERRDQIITTPLTIPDFVGIPSLPLINAGIVENKGFEAVAEWQKQTDLYGFFIRGNYTFARNKIVELTEPDILDRVWQARTGRRINEHYGLRAIGLFRDQEDINSSPRQTFGTVQPGDIKYADMNGDGVIDAQDEGYLGRISIPESMAGLSIGANYKGFDVSILFQGAFGAYVYYGGLPTYPFSRFAGVISEVKGNYFSAENPDVNALYPRMTSNENANNYRISSFWHRNCDYIRLKNAEIGYTLSPKLVRRAGINKARVFVNAANLVTWSDITTFDPEIPDGTGNYPQQKVLNIGLNFTF